MFVYFFPISSLGASNTEEAQSKDVSNENLEFLTCSAVCLLPAVCLLFPKSSLGAFDTEKAQSKDDTSVLQSI